MADNFPVETPVTNLSRAFEFSGKEIISLVGGGGKSTLMKKLALELSGAGYRVVVTTTTHILPDQAVGYFIREENSELLLLKARQAIASNPVVTLTCKQEPGGKLAGPDPVMIPAFLDFADYILVEADGAQRKPLKAPNQTEPVIVPDTTTVIALAGIDGVGKPARETVFRWEIARTLTGLGPDDVVTTQAAATLLSHPDGITRTSPTGSRKIAFINKVETERQVELAAEIVKALKQHSIFNRVIIGSLEGIHPLVQLYK